MPFTIEVSDAGRRLTFRGSGVVTGAEIFEAKARLEADPEAIKRLRTALIDFDEATALQVSELELRRLVAQDKQWTRLTPDLRLAAAMPPGHMYGIARMYQTLMEVTQAAHWNVKVFWSRTLAEEWLHDEDLRAESNPGG